MIVVSDYFTIYLLVYKKTLTVFINNPLF